MLETPYERISKPEALKNQLAGLWSRRIDEKHRLVYFINTNGDIEVLACKSFTPINNLFSYHFDLQALEIKAFTSMLISNRMVCKN